MHKQNFLACLLLAFALQNVNGKSMLEIASEVLSDYLVEYGEAQAAVLDDYNTVYNREILVEDARKHIYEIRNFMRKQYDIYSIDAVQDVAQCLNNAWGVAGSVEGKCLVDINSAYVLPDLSSYINETIISIYDSAGKLLSSYDSLYECGDEICQDDKLMQIVKEMHTFDVNRLVSDSRLYLVKNAAKISTSANNIVKECLRKQMDMVDRMAGCVKNM